MTRRVHYDPTESRAPAGAGSATFMARWVEALHGVGELPSALLKLIQLVGAVEISLLRLPKDKTSAKRIACASTSDGKLFAPHLVKHFAPNFMDLTNSSVLEGAIWSMTDALASGDLKMQLSQEIRIKENHLREVIIISLENHAKHIDALELHFRTIPAEHNRVLLIALSQEISFSWRRRLPGTAQRSLHGPVSQADLDQQEPEKKDILHPDNPMALSRCEFRICLMMRDGLVVKEIVEALAISEATVRSHLGSIYSKTVTSGQLDLVHRLINADAASKRTNRYAA